MITLPKSTQAWNSGDFEDILKKELEALGLDHLPLQQGLSHSSFALDHHLKMVILNIQEQDNLAMIKAGAFYSGIVAGCSCSDDPSPTDEVNEYCEMDITLNLTDGQASIALSSENY